MTSPATTRPSSDRSAASGVTTRNDVHGKPPEDDGPLDSIGKAVTDPVTSAAADEEPDERGLPPVRPGD